MKTNIEFREQPDNNSWNLFVPVSRTHAFIDFLRPKIKNITLNFDAFDESDVLEEDAQDIFLIPTEEASKEQVENLIRWFEKSDDL